MSTSQKRWIATPDLVELDIVEILLDDARGPYARLRAIDARSTKNAKKGAAPLPVLAIPLGITEATMLGCLLAGRRLDRPTWQSMYLASLSSAGMMITGMELEPRASPSVAAIFLEQIKKTRKSAAGPAIAAPIDAALLLAYESKAPVYISRDAVSAFAETGNGAGLNAGRALLADLLAHLPDEDFGKWKM